jgi:hypothetical protein
LATVSIAEYWVINGPDGGEAKIQLTLTGTSEIAAGLEDINNLRIVEWVGGQWEIVSEDLTISADNIDDGTITTNNPVSFNGTAQYFTLGSVNQEVAVTPPIAEITSTDEEICEGEVYDLVIELFGEGPWEVRYTDGLINYPVETIQSSTTTISVQNLSSGIKLIELLEVRDKYGIVGEILGETVEVTVKPRATAEITRLISDTPVCEGEVVELEITFTGTPTFNFTISDNHGRSWSGNSNSFTNSFAIPDTPAWISPALPTIYTYTITSITDNSGCGAGNVLGSSMNVEVFKIPETGPQYHIPNTFGD